jgi:hypothetical protein
MSNQIVICMRRFKTQSVPSVHEPKVTPSILAKIPDCLRQTLEEAVKNSEKRRSVLISSNNLANRFIFSQWKIRPSQRRRYRNLFTTVRKRCRDVFNHHLSHGGIEWSERGEIYLFGVYKFDEIRGNLILGFVNVPDVEDWKLPLRKNSKE